MGHEELQQQIHRSLLMEEEQQQQEYAPLASVQITKEQLEEREYQVNQKLQQYYRNQLGLTNMDSPVLESEENAKLLREREEVLKRRELSVERQESGKKKQRDQEKDATARAIREQKVHGVTRQDPALAESLTKAKREEEDNPLPKYDKVEVKVNGSEFTPDPSTGKVDLDALQALRRKLVHNIGIPPDRADVEEQVTHAAQQELLPLLDEALKTYYAAGGVNMEDGTSINSFKAKSASKKLALAIEKYEEAAQKMEETIKQRFLKNLVTKADNRDFRNGMENSNPSQLQEGVHLTALGAIYESEISRMLEKYPEEYQQNREKVQQLIQEFLAVGEKQAEHEVKEDIIRRRINVFTEAERTDVEQSIIKDLDKASAMGERQLERIFNALKVLLEHKEPKTMADAAYMDVAWGIKTKAPQGETYPPEVKQGMAEYEKIYEGKPAATKEEATRRALEGRMVLKFYQMKRKIDQEAEEEPDNAVVQKIKERFDRCQYGGQPVLQIFESIAYVENRSAEVCARGKVWRQRSVMEFNGGIAEGQLEGTMGRDAESICKPVGQAMDATEEDVHRIHLMQTILDGGVFYKTVNGEKKVVPVTQEQYNETAREYFKVSKAGYLDIKRHMEAHPKLLNPNCRGADLLEQHSYITLLHRTLQGLSDSTSLLFLNRKFLESLTKDEYEEMVNIKSYLYGVKEYIRIRMEIINDEHRSQLIATGPLEWSSDTLEETMVRVMKSFWKGLPAKQRAAERKIKVQQGEA